MPLNRSQQEVVKKTVSFFLLGDLSNASDRVRVWRLELGRDQKRPYNNAGSEVLQLLEAGDARYDSKTLTITLKEVVPHERLALVQEAANRVGIKGLGIITDTLPPLR